MDTINVQTAYDGCSNDCGIFEIEETNFYADGSIYRGYRCIHIQGCSHLLAFVSCRKKNEDTDHE